MLIKQESETSLPVLIKQESETGLPVLIEQDSETGLPVLIKQDSETSIKSNNAAGVKLTSLPVHTGQFNLRIPGQMVKNEVHLIKKSF